MSKGSFKLVCEECGHRNHNGKLVDIKEREVNSQSNAELLATIHRVKTGHDPEVVGG